jgi:hypothetical protein
MGWYSKYLGTSAYSDLKTSKYRFMQVLVPTRNYNYKTRDLLEEI